MGVSSAIRAGAAYVEVFLEENRLTRGLNAAATRLRSWSASLSSLGARASGGGLPEPLASIAHFAASPAGLFTGLLEATRRAAESGAQWADLAEKAGVSVETISQLAYAARRSAVGVEELSVGLKKMSVNIAGAAHGSAEGQAALAMLGMTVDQLANLAPDEQFRTLADRIAAIANPTERAAAAIKIFGRSGSDLLPLLMQGADGIARWEARARELGLVKNTGAAESARDFSRLLGDMWDVLRSSVNVIGSALIPYLKSFVDWIIRATVTTRNWIQEHRGLVVVLFKVAGSIVAAGAACALLGKVLGIAASGLGGIASAFTLLGRAVGAGGAILSAIWSGVSTAIGALVPVLSFLVTPLGAVIAAVVALGTWWLVASGNAARAVNYLAGVFRQLRDDAVATFGGIADALVAGDIGLAVKVLWTAIKMEWQAGINWVKKLWSDFKWYFLVVWNEASSSLAAKFIEAWSGIQKAWVNVVAFMRKVWNDFCTSAGNLWNRAQQSAGGLLINALQKVGVLSEEEAQWATQDLNRNVEQKIADRTATGQGRDTEIETGRQAELDRINQDQQDRLRVLDQDRETYNARQNQQYEADLRARQAEYDRARSEWQAARDEAAAKRAAMRGPTSSEGKQLTPLDVSGALKDKLSVSGTFSSAAISGMGAGGGHLERIARGIERLQQLDERMIKVDENMLRQMREGVAFA